jgi:hypothetical protein
MATLRHVKALAKVLGAKVEDDKIGNTHECRVESPHRKYWCEGDVHELIACTNRPWKPDYADLLSRMGYGLADCIGECEWCDGDDIGCGERVIEPWKNNNE